MNRVSCGTVQRLLQIGTYFTVCVEQPIQVPVELLCSHSLTHTHTQLVKSAMFQFKHN